MGQSSKLQAIGAFGAILVAAVVLAQPGALADEGGLAGQISRSETVMFGQSTSGASAQQRVEALESNIFGKPSSGPLDKRLQKINKMLGLDKASSSESASKAAVVNNANSSQSEAKASPAGKTANKSESAPKNVDQSKSPIKLQPMTAKTDMPPPAPERIGNDLPPVAPPAVLSTKQLLQLGAKRFSEGNAVEANSLFRQVLVHDPNNVDALFNLGALAERRGDFPSALGLYRTALGVRPADTDLKQAVASIQNQMAAGGAGRPLVGDASQTGPFHMPARLGQPLTGGVFDNRTADQFNGQALPPVLGQQPPVGTVVGTDVGMANVTQPPIGLANVTQPNHGKSAAKKVILTGVSIGIGRVLPGPLGALHCPLCELLGHF